MQTRLDDLDSTHENRQIAHRGHMSAEKRDTNTRILVFNFGLCQYHQVKVADLYLPDTLRKPGPSAAADVEVTKGRSPWARRHLARWWWCCAEAVLAMDYW